MSAILMITPAFVAGLAQGTIDRLAARFARWSRLATFAEENYLTGDYETHTRQIDADNLVAYATDYINLPCMCEHGCTYQNTTTDGDWCLHNLPLANANTWHAALNRARTIDLLTTDADADGFVMDEDDTCRRLETPKQARTRKRDERRARAERYAAEIARTSGTATNSIAFIRACVKELKSVRRARSHWNGGESRMEHFAACMHSGAGSATYYQDMDFENGRFASRAEAIEEVVAWIAEYCPMLWASYQEQRMRRRRMIVS